MKSEPLKHAPLHKRISFHLRKEILAGLKPGQRLEAESQLAARYGVSVRTIREALSALAEKGMIERRHGSGTYVADWSAHQHVAIWIASDQVFERVSYWALRSLNHLRVHLYKQGVRTKIYWSCNPGVADPTDGSAEEFEHDLSHRRISAIGIVQGHYGSDIEKLIRRLRVPVVTNTLCDDPDVMAVGANLVKAIEQSVGYLLRQGCRRIAWLGWSDARGLGIVADAGYQKYRSMLSAAGLSMPEHWMRTDLHPTLAGAGYEEFREIWTASREKPDGLLVTDDVLFQDIVTAILELGIAVPEQLKIVAYANRGAVTGAFFPAARVEFDPEANALMMGDMLAKLARRQPIEQRQIQVPFRWMDPVVPQFGYRQVGEISKM